MQNLCKIYAKESFGVFLVWLTFSVPRSLFNWEVPKCFGLFFKSQTRRLEHWPLSEPTVRAQHHISAPLQRPALCCSVYADWRSQHPLEDFSRYAEYRIPDFPHTNPHF